MSEQARKQAFLDALATLHRAFGFQCVATLEAEQLGPVLQVRPGIDVAPIPGWTPPAPVPEGEEPST